MTGLEIGLSIAVVVLIPAIIFKCRITGHVWLHYAYGRLCIWCSKVIVNGEAKL